MQTIEFLEAVLPPSGIYFAAGLTADGFHQEPFDTIQELADYCLQASAAQRDSYFACASFTDKRRDQEHARTLKAFWIDIDCGEGKPYANQQEAIPALKQAIKDGWLPKPSLLVNSGNGFHVYWVLTDEIDKQAWKTIATVLKRLVAKSPLRADPGPTSNAAQILRPVGTNNYKRDPKPVSLLRDSGDRYHPMAFAKQLKAAAKEHDVTLRAVQTAASSTAQADEQWVAGTEYPPVSAHQMAEECLIFKHAKEEHCKDLDYEAWIRVVQTMTYTVECESSHQLIHEWSENDNYDEKTTAYKAASFTDHDTYKPVTCNEYETYASEFCSQCPHFGKINSPIRLGFVRPEHETEIVDERTDSAVSLSPLPEPMREDYYWTKKDRLMGRVWKRVDGKGREADEDEAAIGQAGNEGWQEVWVRICAAFPQVEFTWYDNDAREVFYRVTATKANGITLSGDISARAVAVGKSTMTGELGARLGVNPFGRVTHLEKYMRTWTDYLNETNDLQDMKRHMGWQGENKDKGFLLGATMYYPNGTVAPAVVSKNLHNYVGAHKPRGDVEKAVNAIDKVYNRSDRLPHQFLIMSGLASPLLAQTTKENMGLVVSAVSRETGTGKTTAGRVTTAIYGDPYENTQSIHGHKGSTEHALYVVMGIRKNLPVLIDEVTGWTGQQLGNALHRFSSGSGKVMGNVDGGLKDTAHMNWQNIIIMTSNKQGSEGLVATSGNANPMVARIFEVPFPEEDLNKSEADDAAKSKVLVEELLKHHSGVIGDVWVRHIVALGPEEIDKKVQSVMRWLEKKTKAPSSARYWIRLAALNLVAFVESAKIGLHSFDKDTFVDFTIRLVRRMMVISRNAVRDHDDIISQMLRDFHGGTIYTKDLGTSSQPATPVSVATRMPTGKIQARVITEGVDKGIYIPTQDIREWCERFGQDATALRQSLETAGWMLNKDERFRLGRGTPITAPRARCWKLDYDKVEGATGAKALGDQAANVISINDRKASTDDNDEVQEPSQQEKLPS